MSRPPPGQDPPDHRATALALASWAGALVVPIGLGVPAAVVLVAVLLAVVRPRRIRPGAGTVIACAAAALATLGSAALHAATLTDGPVHPLAADRADARVVVRVDSDPHRSRGRFGDRVQLTGTLERLQSRGRGYRLRSPVRLVLGDGPVPTRGATIAATGRLGLPFRADEAAVLRLHGSWSTLRGPGAVTRAANRVRAGIVRASAGGHGPGRTLVPALVDGADGAIEDRLVADFRTTGLTHLLAVSGTNLTLIVGGLLVLARWLRVRGRGLIVVGGGGVLGFCVLAGPEPSVLRAAAMGAIALLGMGAGGRRRGTRTLGLGVLVLLIASPALATSIGFALSATATAGILVLAPRWRDALHRWLPRWMAEAIAVPLAAQVVCTPLVAAISGQVSLVAVGANLLCGPLVGPATVFGLLGGLLDLVDTSLGRVVAFPAVHAAGLIAAVAVHCAALALPAMSWSTGPLAIGVLVALTLGLIRVLPSVLASRPSGLVAAGGLAAVVLVPLPTPGWPAPHWVMVACSVGQGDALVLRAGPGSAVVVDAGPDPPLIDRCLKRLGITTIPAVVLTHFHADHVDGLAGVLRGRRVGEILTSPLAEPAGGADLVRRLAADRGIPVRPVATGERAAVGALRWQVLAPGRDRFADSDSPPNDASAVLLVETAGIRLLLTGDEERPAQADLRSRFPDLRADVLKVAHHGSSKQDADLVGSLGARLAVVSVGRDNDYGHPAPTTLRLLERARMAVRRTDLDGDIAVVVDDGTLSVVTRPASGPGTVGRP